MASLGLLDGVASDGEADGLDDGVPALGLLEGVIDGVASDGLLEGVASLGVDPASDQPSERICTLS